MTPHRTARAALFLCLIALLAGCASQPAARKDPRDPWERVNRVTQKFNDEVRSFLVFGGADRPGGTGKKGAYPKDEEPRVKEPPK